MRRKLDGSKPWDKLPHWKITMNERNRILRLKPSNETQEEINEVTYAQACPVCFERVSGVGVCEDCISKYTKHTIMRMFNFRVTRRSEDFEYYIQIYPEAAKFRDYYV